MKCAAIIGSITGVIAAGLDTMQGMYIAETFYWDLDDRTRGFTKRCRPSCRPASSRTTSMPATTPA